MEAAVDLDCVVRTKEPSVTDKTLEDLTCPVCTGLLRDAVACENGNHAKELDACRHVGCDACMRKWLGEKGQCPMCRQATTVRELKPIFRVRQKVAALTVKCPKDGCHWTTSGSNWNALDRHLRSDCGKNIVEKKASVDPSPDVAALGAWFDAFAVLFDDDDLGFPFATNHNAETETDGEEAKSNEETEMDDDLPELEDDYGVVQAPVAINGSMLVQHRLCQVPHCLAIARYGPIAAEPMRCAMHILASDVVHA